jgi:hypothetical protein
MPLPPDDPRHGTPSGYRAGCDDECCVYANYIQRKRADLRRIRVGPARVDAAPARAILQHWMDRGVSPLHVAKASGLTSSFLYELHRRKWDTVHHEILAKLEAITEETLPPFVLVNANITLARIHSMMAGGHSLAWIAQQCGFPATGRWRETRRYKVTMARVVRDLYREAPLIAPPRKSARQSRARALNQGFLPPLAWDDPGTLAEPHGWKPVNVSTTRDRVPRFDEVAVLRRMAGDRTVPVHREESIEVVRRLRFEQGLSHLEIEARTGLNAHRYLQAAARRDRGIPGRNLSNDGEVA